MRWFLDLKQRLMDHGGVLHDDQRDLKEAERTDVFMTSRPVTQKTDGVPVILRAYLKRHGTVAKNLLLLSIEQHNLPVVAPEKQYEIIPLGANVWVIIAHYGFMQKPDVPVHFTRGKYPSGAPSARSVRWRTLKLGKKNSWWIRRRPGSASSGCGCLPCS